MYAPSPQMVQHLGAVFLNVQPMPTHFDNTDESKTCYRIRRDGPAWSLLFLLISLTQGTLQTPGDSKFLPGFVCLFFGWCGYWQWLANPLLFIAMSALHKRRTGLALIISTIAFILALSTFLIRQIEINEAGMKGPVIGYGPGFYLWLLSMAIMVVSSGLYWYFDSREIPDYQ